MTDEAKPDDRSKFRGCKHCAMRRVPGLSYPGHCGGDRDDLPPAYGEGHPLRKLPADWGRSCTKFVPLCS